MSRHCTPYHFFFQPRVARLGTVRRDSLDTGSSFDHDGPLTLRDLEASVAPALVQSFGPVSSSPIAWEESIVGFVAAFPCYLLGATARRSTLTTPYYLPYVKLNHDQLESITARSQWRVSCGEMWMWQDWPEATGRNGLVGKQGLLPPDRSLARSSS